MYPGIKLPTLDSIEDRSFWIVVLGGIVYLVLGGTIAQYVLLDKAFYSGFQKFAISMLLLGFVPLYLKSTQIVVDGANAKARNMTPLSIKTWLPWGVSQYIVIHLIAVLFYTNQAHDDLAAILLCILSPQLAIYLSPIRTLSVVAIAILPTSYALAYTSPFAMSASLFILHALLVGAVQTSMQLRVSNYLLQEANTELKLTQAKLRQNAEQEERLRISRDLHDRLGHHLTALSIQLQVANLMAESPLKEEIAKSQTAAKTLLNDVRMVVGELRSSTSIPLFDRLTELFQNLGQLIPGVIFNLQVYQDDFPINQREQDILFLCLQELVTNSLKHGQPDKIELRVNRQDGQFDFVVEDFNLKVGDGWAQVVTEGNGLKGVRERMVALDGRLVASYTDTGFKAILMLPLTSVDAGSTETSLVSIS